MPNETALETIVRHGVVLVIVTGSAETVSGIGTDWGLGCRQEK